MPKCIIVHALLYTYRPHTGVGARVRGENRGFHVRLYPLSPLCVFTRARGRPRASEICRKFPRDVFRTITFSRGDPLCSRVGEAVEPAPDVRRKVNPSNVAFATEKRNIALAANGVFNKWFSQYNSRTSRYVALTFLTTQCRVTSLAIII